MARHIAVGIDIGTYHVKVVVAEYVETEGRSFPRIIGTGLAESKGLRHGYIINIQDVAESVARAAKDAETAAGIQIRRGYLSIGGIGLESVVASGSVVISRADYEITELDEAKVTEDAESRIPQPSIINRKILHHIPLEYKIDGRKALSKPTGLKGMRLEGKILFVTCLEHHLNDLISAVEAAGIEVLDTIAAPIAASLVTLSRAQKTAGCVLANIGAETVSIAVFENNLPISIEVLPIGSTDITHDIALGLKIPIEEAEEVKRRGSSGTPHPRRKLDEIILARLTDIFELVEAHLKKIGKNGLLPAGIVITGGGGSITTIDELARATLRLPSRVATLEILRAAKTEAKDGSWAVAYGLCILGFSEDAGSMSGNSLFSGLNFSKIGHTLSHWFKQFLP